MSSSATLHDVAELAGVSIGTASQALNGKPNVAAGTRAKVMDAARTLGYFSKERSPDLSEERLGLVGMLTKHDLGSPIVPNPFYSHVQMGVEAECRRLGINLMYAHLEVTRKNLPVAWPAMLQDGALDGLLLIGAFIEDTVELINRRLDKLPVVLVDSYAPNLPLDTILIDNQQGMISAVEHLVALGHRHIGLIGWNEDAAPSVDERRDGYLQALRRHGLPEQYIEPSALNRDGGVRATHQLLQRAPEVTALIACNDDTAIGALTTLRQLGLDVPGHCSLVGFDNIDLARDVTPALTTVHIYKSWLGALGLRQLLLRANNQEMPKVTTRLTTELIVRASSGPVRIT